MSPLYDTRLQKLRINEILNKDDPIAHHLFVLLLEFLFKKKYICIYFEKKNIRVTSLRKRTGQRAERCLLREPDLFIFELIESARQEVGHHGSVTITSAQLWTEERGGLEKRVWLIIQLNCRLFNQCEQSMLLTRIDTLRRKNLSDLSALIKIRSLPICHTCRWSYFFPPLKDFYLVVAHR